MQAIERMFTLRLAHLKGLSSPYHTLKLHQPHTPTSNTLVTRSTGWIASLLGHFSQWCLLMFLCTFERAMQCIFAAFHHCAISRKQRYTGLFHLKEWVPVGNRLCILHEICSLAYPFWKFFTHRSVWWSLGHVTQLINIFDCNQFHTISQKIHNMDILSFNCSNIYVQYRDYLTCTKISSAFYSVIK